LEHGTASRGDLVPVTYYSSCTSTVAEFLALVLSSQETGAVLHLAGGLFPVPSTSAASVQIAAVGGESGDDEIAPPFTMEVFAVKIVPAMELITILDHCHRHRGFVYQHARFGPDQKSI
jgi:hypothetical protein